MHAASARFAHWLLGNYFAAILFHSLPLLFPTMASFLASYSQILMKHKLATHNSSLLFHFAAPHVSLCSPICLCISTRESCLRVSLASPSRLPPVSLASHLAFTLVCVVSARICAPSRRIKSWFAYDSVNGSSSLTGRLVFCVSAEPCTFFFFFFAVKFIINRSKRTSSAVTN